MKKSFGLAKVFLIGVLAVGLFGLLSFVFAGTVGVNPGHPGSEICDDNFCVADNGNVGIGTVNPSYKFEINLSASDKGIAIGQNSQANGDYSFAFGSPYQLFNPAAYGDYSFAFGQGAQAFTTNSIAIGKFSRAIGDNSISIGNDGYISNYKYTTALGDYSTALGNEVTAFGDYSTALGNLNSNASGINSLALGSWSTASGDKSIAVGSWSSEASGVGSSVIGGWSNFASGLLSVAMGERSTASHRNSFVVGLDPSNNNANCDSSGDSQFKICGNLEVTGSCSGGNSCDQDVAEAFNQLDFLESGDVVVIVDSSDYKSVKKTSIPMDKLVVGVISTSPAMVMGSSGNNSVNVALTGVVPTKVDSSFGNIEVGDLLTSSPTSGHAMKCSGDCSGAIIGKALQSFSGGRGKINIIVLLG